MDTILFFCKKRGLQEPAIEPIGMRSHQLIRILLDVGQEEWFGMKMVPKEREILPIRAGTEGDEKNTGGCGQDMEGRDKKSEGRGQDTEGRDKKSEGRGQDTEGRDKKSEGRGQDTEGRDKKSEGRGQDIKGWGRKPKNREQNMKEWGKKPEDRVKRGKGEDNAEDRGQNADSREKRIECRIQDAGIHCASKRKHRGLPGVLITLFGSREKRAEKEYRKEREQEQIRLLHERQEVLDKVEEGIQKLLSDVLSMIGNWEGCFCVYEDGIYRALEGRIRDNCIETKNAIETNMQEESSRKENDMQEDILPVLWKKYFRVREFHDYMRQLWVEELLPEAVLPHFVILGTASCLHILIEKYADRMKSLRWILPESDYSQEVQEFVEDFYIEYGLAIMLQITPAGQRGVQVVCTEPSNILDFTKESHIHLAKVAKGSIWLDMLSVEEKKRRIVGRSTEIAYFSLKEKWRLARKKEPYVPEM